MGLLNLRVYRLLTGIQIFCRKTTYLELGSNYTHEFLTLMLCSQFNKPKMYVAPDKASKQVLDVGVPFEFRGFESDVMMTY